MFQCYGSTVTQLVPQVVTKATRFLLRNTGKIGDLQKIPRQALEKGQKYQGCFFFGWIELLKSDTLVFSLRKITSKVGWNFPKWSATWRLSPAPAMLAAQAGENLDSFQAGKIQTAFPGLRFGIPDMKAKLAWKACHVAASGNYGLFVYWMLLSHLCGNTRPEFHAQQQPCFRTFRHCTTQERPQQCSCLVHMAQHNKLWLAMTEIFGTKGSSSLRWVHV